MFEHRIDNGQQFSHTGNQSNFGSLTRITQSFVERADDRITSAGNQGSHVKCGPYGGSTSPDRATASEGTTVAIQWGDANQGGNLLTVEFSEFGQLRQQGTANDGADSRYRLEQVLVLTPDRTLTDSLIEVMVGSFEFFFQPADVNLDASSQSFGGTGEAVCFGHDHLGDLSPTSNQCTQFQGDLIGQGTNRWPYGLGETGKDPSIDAIGLGQLPSGFGEISDLSRVDYDHRKLRTGQSPHDLPFKTAGGFHNDQRGTDLCEPFDQRFNSCSIVRHALSFIRRSDCHIQACFGDVNTNKISSNFQNSVLHYFWLPPTQLNLANDAGLMTQATVRAFREAERDDPCSPTASYDLGVTDLSRPVSY